MSVSGKRYVAYIGIHRSSDSPLTRGGILLSSSIDDVEEWRHSQSPKKDNDEDELIPDNAPIKEDDKKSHEENSSIIEIIRGCKNTLSSYHSLINVSAVIIPTIPWITVAKEIYDEVNNSCDKLYEDNGIFTFGICEDNILKIRRLIGKMNDMRKGLSVLPGSIILSLVANFDSYFVDAVRMVLLSRPERYDNSDRQMTVKEILAMSSFEDVRWKIINDEVDGLMRGSHLEQIKFIEKNLHISITEDFDRYPEYLEIFERRNIVAHGKHIVNEIYLRNCKAFGYNVKNIKEGDKLNLDHIYLHKSVDTLIEIYVKICYLLWKKHFEPSDVNIAEIVSEIAFRFIEERNYSLALRLYEFLLNDKKSNFDESCRKKYIINLSNCYRNIEKNEACDDLLNKTDWSATSNTYRICVASLRDDLNEFLRLMPLVSNDEMISKTEIREWPVFKWMRSKDEVKLKFEELFGEPLRAPTRDETIITKEKIDNADDAALETETRH